MLWGNSPICSRLPYRYAIGCPFFAAYFIISSPSRDDMFSHPTIISDPALIATQSPWRGSVKVGVKDGACASKLSAPILVFPRHGGKNSHLRLFAGLLFFFGLSLFSVSVVFAEPLRIAYTSISMTYGPLWLTKEAGIFRKYNIEPEMLYIAGGPPSLQALIAGDVAISFTAAGAVFAANLSGSDAVVIGTTIDSLPFELYSVPTIKEPAQLRGTKMGVSRIGATTDFIARYILKKWGLQADKDVAIFQAGAGPQIFTALKSGAIQSGVLSTGVETVRARADGYFRLADISMSGLVYPFGPFAARLAFLKSNSPLVSRFMHAYVEGIHRFKTDKEAALAII